MAPGAGEPAVFLSFRSADAGSYAAVYLDDVLTRLFGAEHVFRSSRSIAAGSAFDRVILDGLRRATALLAIIGPDWLTASLPGGDGTPLLAREDDWVRREVGDALRRDLAVIPVLLTGASRPARHQLPADLADLADRQAVYLRHRHIDQDAGHLVREILRVSPALATLHLLRPRPRLPAGGPPSVLLRAEHAVVPFAGRDTELAELRAWAGSADRVAARLLTGPGGHGKSRLAAALCDEFSARGWLAGVLSEHAEAATLARAGELGVPMLVVVDYAEAGVDQVSALAEALVARPAGAASARLLLLARSAGGWARPLRAHPDDEVAALFLGLVEQPLGPLAARPASRLAEFARARRVFAERLGLPLGEAKPGDHPVQELDGALDLHTAALASLLDEGGAELLGPPGRTGPVIRLLHHEQRYWARTAHSVGLPDPHPRRIDAAVAAATLFGPADREGALRVLPSLTAFVGSPPDVVGRYLDWLTELYPGPGAVNPLRPDRLGEEHVAATVVEQPDVAVAPLAVATEAQVDHALSVLGAAGQRHPAVAAVVHAMVRSDPVRLGRVLATAAARLANPGFLIDVLTEDFATDPSPGRAELLLAAIPDDSTAFTDLAVLVTEQALHAVATGPERVVLLERYAARLARAGRLETALATATEAVDLARRLVGVDAGPGATPTAHLAESLRTRSAVLGGLARPEQALGAAEEAVALYRRLRLDGGVTWGPRLGAALTNLAARRLDAGHVEAALDAAREAVDLWEWLRLRRPVRFVPHLASAYDILGRCLAGAGRHFEAARHASVAVDHYRSLAARRPDRFEPLLALATNNRSRHLAAAGDQEAALADGVESARIYRRLAERQPGRFQAEAAVASANLADRLRERGEAPGARRLQATDAADALAAPGSAGEARLAGPPTIVTALLGAAGVTGPIVAAEELARVCALLDGGSALLDRGEFLEAVGRAGAPIWDDAFEAAPDELALRLGRWHLDLAAPNAHHRLLAVVLAVLLARSGIEDGDLTWAALVLPHVLDLDDARLESGPTSQIVVPLATEARGDDGAPRLPDDLTDVVNPQDLAELHRSLAGLAAATGHVRLPLGPGRVAPET